MKQKNILFICKHNIFRSRVAEEYLKKISDFNVQGAGIVMGDCIPESTKKSAEEFGLDISYKPKSLSIDLLKSQDIVVVVASDVPKEVFDSPLYELEGKVRFWNIDDTKNLFDPDIENNRKIIKKITAKVDELNDELKEEENGKN